MPTDASSSCDEFASLCGVNSSRDALTAVWAVNSSRAERRRGGRGTAAARRGRQVLEGSGDHRDGFELAALRRLGVLA